MSDSDVARAREELKKLYPYSERIANASDKQVLAIYLRVKNQGKLAK